MKTHYIKTNTKNRPFTEKEFNEWKRHQSEIHDKQAIILGLYILIIMTIASLF